MLRMLVSVLVTAAVVHAETPLTIDELCEQEPERIERLFEMLDLERPALAAVRTSVQAKQWPTACNSLLEHYRERFADAAIVPTGVRVRTHEATDAMLDDTFTVQGVTDRVPRLDTGGLDWNHRGPAGDREWAWLLNRHSHLRSLLGAYSDTGDSKYVRGIDAQLQDWILANPYPGEKSETGPWRGLEAALRTSPWIHVFTGLINNEAFSPVTTVLMLSSLPDHADYLKRYHAQHGNWITMEMNGLMRVAETWPEFRHSDAWVAYAVEQMTPALLDQVYSDGAQTELTSHYHRGALSNFERFANRAGKNGVELPPVWTETLENMWNYLAYTMRPDGYGALNNDSDRDYNRDSILAAADRYEREDWRYIATNGTEGVESLDTASTIFPWAGHAVFRSGWDADAEWLFFDYGPFGTGHQHYDKLHLSLSAYGRDLLVDSGRFTYAGGPWRYHFKGTAAHNTLLIDGREQLAYAKRSIEPTGSTWKRFLGESDDRWMTGYARGVFDGGYEEIEAEVTHTRVVTQQRNIGYIVVDKVETDRPRKVTALWHFHPDCAVDIEDQDVITRNDRGNLRIQPVGDLEWDVSIVSGQEDPIQGWYSVRYNSRVPAPCAVYTTTIDKTAVLAWRFGVGADTPPARDLVLSVEGGDATVIHREGKPNVMRIPIEGL